jgi:hypothetical protein
LLVHQLLSIYLAGTIPLCCCQIAALADALTTALRGNGECCVESCCQAEEDVAQDIGSCCGTKNKSGSHRGCDGECCKRVAAHVAGPAWKDVHSLAAAFDLPSICAFSILEPWLQATAPRLHSGPPPRPSGRDALALHAVLVI